MGTEMRLGHCTYLGDAWSLLDCPGSVEFAYETACALAVVDLAVVVCEPVPSRALTVAPLLRALDAQRVPHMLFVNKIDTLDGRVRDTLTALQAHSRVPLVLRQVPMREGETVYQLAGDWPGYGSAAVLGLIALQWLLWGRRRARRS